MIIDNTVDSKKLHEWINESTETGKFDIVTGYFTVGALAYLSEVTNTKINQYRLILGDIVSVADVADRPLNLLNENICIDAALKLSNLAKEAVEFLRQDKVLAKTLEPNFCHAKVYLHTPEKDPRLKYYITGSSNLTEAGFGLKETNNVELNIGETGNNSLHKDLSEWFGNLWKNEKAHVEKTIYLDNGKTKKVDFKEYLIHEIEKIFIEYTPRELYFKVLFELFGSQMNLEGDDPDFNRQIGKLENTVVYQTLYKFQQKGALSLIRMLQKYNGAILADAVGLGKTWTALAVMKFFELQGREIILLCPKKLQNNWLRYRKNQNSKFERDRLDYFVRFHTDLHSERLDRNHYKNENTDTHFIDDKPKLFVIDESHNLRNDKSNSYKFFLEEILKKNQDAKVLMLSATPINNTLNDIRNQFKLMVAGDVRGFYDTLDVKNVDYVFKKAQQSFKNWRESENPKIKDFVSDLPAEFFNLTDSLTVSRTRNMILGQQAELIFPKKTPPENLFITPKDLGNFESFEELFRKFPPMLSGYQPAFYAEPMAEKKARLNANQDGKSSVSVLEDEIQRDKFLVKMMYILMVKRLESSWFSFFETVKKIYAHHENALNKIKLYQENKKNSEIANQSELNNVIDEEADDDLVELSLGKKRIITLREIDEAGNLNLFKKDLKKDLDALDNIISNLKRFEDTIIKELRLPKNKKSADVKLQVLIEKILAKQRSGNNNDNQKLVIFTVYRDTAEYLFDQLKQRGVTKIAMISGTGSKTDDKDTEVSDFEPILERFAPFTKLFKEREWQFKPSDDGLTDDESYREWISWVSANDRKTYEKIQHPIDILIATDALSEGQNLQDADMVVNYDIHWNPVRIIQRMGRIDRLGSPNKRIFGINFWPSDNINNYLDLQGRIEQRMAAMQLAGSEVQLDFSDTFKEMAEDTDLEQRLKSRMLQQMQTNWEDIEVNDESFGFNHLSLEKYRQDLLEEYNQNSKKYSQMPNGVYTGFKASKALCSENGIIALLGYPAREPKEIKPVYQQYNLIYIDKEGKPVLLNQKEVLDALTLHKDEPRYVLPEIDRGDPGAIAELSAAIQSWLSAQAIEEKENEDGTVTKQMGQEVKNILVNIKKGNSQSISTVKEGKMISQKYKADNFDLLVWFLVTK